MYCLLWSSPGSLWRGPQWSGLWRTLGPWRKLQPMEQSPCRSRSAGKSSWSTGDPRTECSWAWVGVWQPAKVRPPHNEINKTTPPKPSPPFYILSKDTEPETGARWGCYPPSDPSQAATWHKQPVSWLGAKLHFSSERNSECLQFLFLFWLITSFLSQGHPSYHHWNSIDSILSTVTLSIISRL